MDKLGFGLYFLNWLSAFVGSSFETHQSKKFLKFTLELAEVRTSPSAAPGSGLTAR